MKKMAGENTPEMRLETDYNYLNLRCIRSGMIANSGLSTKPLRTIRKEEIDRLDQKEYKDKPLYQEE